MITTGDRVKVTAPGTFYGYTGHVARVTQHGKRSSPYYWIVFDSHPWQQPGVDWSFRQKELEACQ